MAARIADTSWLYAIFDRDDAHHLEACATLMEPRITLVPAPILHETLDLVKHRAGKAAALQVLDAMRAFPHFDLSYPVDEGAREKAWREAADLSIHDAAVAALAKQTGFGVATFDKRLAAACVP